MAIDRAATKRELIVSLRAVDGLRQLEARAPAAAAAEVNPLEQALVLNRSRLILQRLESETNLADPDVLVTVPDRETSLLQSALAREATDVQPLGPGGLEVKFGTGVKGGDWFGWMRSLFDWIDRSEAHRLLRPSSTTPTRVGNQVRIAMVADWGTGLYGAPVSAASIARTGPYDLLMHLGDVYYSGTKDEVQERFLAMWPLQAGPLSRALNSNHEMYSGGFGYFGDTLAKFGQESSYFAFENDHWLLIGLDTAYVDHDIDQTQAGWINEVIKGAAVRSPGTRKKIVLFSHQQLFSRLSDQGPKLKAALAPLLDGRLVTAWYWGHEHQCIFYDPHATYGLHARCLGHGGIPEARHPEVKSAPTDKTTGAISWKRLGATVDSPACLVLDGRNEYVKGKEERFAPHGYMTLELKGPTLVERAFLPDGDEIYRNQLA